MNVTADEFKVYVETFHRTLEDTAKQYLPAELQQSLFHLSFQPCALHAYVSTQFGVAWEYVPIASGNEVTLGSRRIEGLFLNHPTRFEREFASRGPAVMVREGARVTLRRVSITNEPRPLRLDGARAQVTLIDCHFDALGWSRDVAGAEIFGNRSHSSWSVELAIGRAKDEVLAALAEAHRAARHDLTIDQYVNTRKQNTVLVLGDYSTAGTERLNVVCQCLVDLGYEPFLVKDVPDIFASDLQQKVMILGGLARFVIIDDSSASGHLSEIQIAQQNRWTTVLLRARGMHSSWMTAGLSFTSNVISEQEFDPLAPHIGVEKAVAWAESQINDLDRKYKKLYPWRLP
ncbi:MAG: hypothetical protein LAP38_14605 [Acidobacteriia bacterium]|nr:hypothetical protein [Terriglobia bacterium]